MRAHTPEPWRWVEADVTSLAMLVGADYDAKACTGTVCHFGDDTEYYPSAGEEPNDADKERIVACINACAGMADPEKEISALKEAVNAGQSTVLAAEMFAAKNAEINELRTALLCAAGMISTTPTWSDKHPQEAYDYLIQAARDLQPKSERRSE